MTNLDLPGFVAGRSVRTKGLSWIEYQGSMDLPAYGWKIHVSCHADELSALLASVLPALKASQCTFKIAASRDDVIQINSGRAGVSQIGKVLTVYCAGEPQAGELAQALAQHWTSLRGPEVPNEWQLTYPSRVYLRFGGFKVSWRIDAFGRPQRGYINEKGVFVEDSVGEKPLERWMSGLPLRMQTPASLPEILHGPQGSLVLAQRLNSSQHLTGLYISQEDAQSWIVKIPRGEALRHHLLNEHSVLSRIGRKSVLHKSFILQIQNVPGICAEALPPWHLLKCFPKLLAKTAELHHMGWIHRDLKWSNVLWSETGLYLIDFELACRSGSRMFPEGGTRGHQAPESYSANPMTPACDVFALGACWIHALLKTNPSFLPPQRDAIDKLLEVHGVSRETRRLIWEMRAPMPEQRPSIEDIQRKIKNEQKLF